MKKLHRLLFFRIYDWAGEIRRIDISKERTRFCTSSRIEPEANKIFNSFINNKYFENSSPNALIKQMAELYADLNMVHPFREQCH
jgi:cell filamentation protein